MDANDRQINTKIPKTDRIGSSGMYHEEFSPAATLKPYIRSYFHIRVESGEFHFPADGCPGLIFNLADPFQLGFEAGHLTPFSGGRLFGSQSRNLLTRHSAGQTELLAVKFHPGQLPRFIDVPAMEVTDTSVSLEYLWGTFGKELVQRLFEADRLSKGVGLLNNVFLKLLSREKNYDDRITAALGTMSCCRGQVRIEDLAGGLNLSRRQFERRFLNHVGLPPKRMCRIIRFLNVFTSVTRQQKKKWADLAFEYGYSDQAHLVRECKYFTGRSPLSYVQNQSALEHMVTGPSSMMSHFFNTTAVAPVTLPSTAMIETH